MRRLQITLFAVGITAFVAALAVAGSALGDIFWRIGVAVMLSDLVVQQLWPAPGPHR
jgi:hypothetical protein